jgi:hypothetical protein
MLDKNEKKLMYFGDLKMTTQIAQTKKYLKLIFYSLWNTSWSICRFFPIFFKLKNMIYVFF